MHVPCVHCSPAPTKFTATVTWTLIGLHTVCSANNAEWHYLKDVHLMPLERLQIDSQSATGTAAPSNTRAAVIGGPSSNHQHCHRCQITADMPDIRYQYQSDTNVLQYFSNRSDTSTIHISAYSTVRLKWAYHIPLNVSPHIYSGYNYLNVKNLLTPTLTLT